MKNQAFTLIELVIVCALVGLLLVLFPLLGLWTQRSLDFWLTHFKGVPVHVPYWLSLLTAVVLNGIAVGANVLAEIARLAI